jgi:phage antirepressor YoqD-like protein
MSKDRPNHFFNRTDTRELVHEIQKAGIPAIETKQGLGTYVCKELVYAYAMWISPQFNLKVIRAFDALATGKVQVVQPQQHHHAIPQTFSEALRLAADERELADKLALEIKTQADVIAEQAPKVELLKQIAAGDFHYHIGVVAKGGGVNPNDLRRWMQDRSNRWLYKQGKCWVPYQDKIDRGLMVVKEWRGVNYAGEEIWNSTPLLTASGKVEVLGEYIKAICP